MIFKDLIILCTRKHTHMPKDTYATPFNEQDKFSPNGLSSSSQIPGINTNGTFPVLPIKIKNSF